MAIERLQVPEPLSAGVLLSYKCNCTCKHCLYACSPEWPADWLTVEDGERILAQLSAAMRGRYPFPGRVGVNDGVHFTGGEPFLNFDLLLRLTALASRLDVPIIFCETNGFWCRDDAGARDKLLALRDAGMHGILISANPFILERIPFERTERAARLSREVFGSNAIVYQTFFFRQFQEMGLRGTLPFDDYVARAGYGLRHVELFANGRVPYALGHLFERHPASSFFGTSCRPDLVREWHIHVDNYGNYLPGWCGGLSFGDARDLAALCRGVDLDSRPVLRALVSDLANLYRLGLDHGYRTQPGYVSKCHLCLDIRRHLARHGDFVELAPAAFYERLEDAQ
ncbi:MAG: radical SAM protein [Anaerolineae bacterium]